MVDQMIKVEFVGGLEFIFEYNGKRYAFSKRNKIIEMPVAAYAYAVANAGFAANDIIPYNESAGLRAENIVLKAEIERLKRRPVKKEKKR